MTAMVATRMEVPLIDGEDPTTMRSTDARRWIEIYARLIELKEEMLERVLASTGPGQADEQVVRKELERLRSRLGFWQGRHSELAPVDLDDRLGIVTATGATVPLTRRESQLLRFLHQNPGRFFDAHTLAAKAWQDPSLAAEQVRTYVVRLRRRLLEAQVGCDIQTERRRGYSLVFEQQIEESAG